MTIETATLGGGCFWCTEAVFDDLDGVLDVVSGYSGGSTPDPTYRTICTGLTGHAEVVQLKFDRDRISFRDVLGVFFATHDPTTLNRQGADVGTQYRSVVFYHTPEQRRDAQELVAELNRDRVFDAPVVTEIAPVGAFHEAEPEHQEYYARNPGAGYCRAVISPKVAKFRKQFAARLKASA